MPEEEKRKSSVADRVIEVLMGQVLRGVTKTAERFVKRILRLVGLVLAGLVITVVGVAFLAVGAVRWLAALMPTWLAWLIVGLVLFLTGIALTLGALASARS